MKKSNLKRFGKLSVAFFGTIIIATGLSSCENENESNSLQDKTNMQLLAKDNNATQDQIIEIVNRHCGTIDYNIDGSPDEEFGFNSIEEFEQTISEICNSSVRPINLKKTASSTPCGDGMYTGSISIGPTYNLNVWVTITNGRVSAVGSGLSGYHMGISWNQSGWTQNGSNVTVGGTFTFGLGFGIYSWARTYTLVLPC